MKAGGRKKWKEARKEGEERTRGRKTRKEGNIAPTCGLLPGGSAGLRPDRWGRVGEGS